MIFKQQNRSIPIPQPAWNFKLLILVAIFLLSTNNVFGSSPFSDDFEAYIVDENLTGQGDWESGAPYNSLKVSDTEAKSGLKSVNCYFGYCANDRTGEQIENGVWIFYTFLSEFRDINLEIRQGSSSICRAVLSGNAKVWGTGTHDTGWPVLFDEWQQLQIEWNSATDQCRIQYGTSTWSIWWDAYDPFSYIDTLRIYTTLTPDGNRFVDFISDKFSCDSEHCELCEVYDTCSNAGCYWYYSIYLQEYYCVEPFTPDAEACGSFYKCQYCLTQTPCEAELNCEWKDIGYGDKCYMIEPTIPPPQADWEMPDLEDCGELSGAEEWLCKIKNMIAGAFMPSTTTTEALYQTIGAFKEKFPFNYVAGLNSFFTSVSEGLEATTTIPIEILGATSTINFTFWNSTTTIGGEEETFKNVLYDFTTFVILMCWFVWLVSIIKRFF